jgi:SAM-dependent methyltransferase
VHDLAAPRACSRIRTWGRRRAGSRSRSRSPPARSERQSQREGTASPRPPPSRGRTSGRRSPCATVAAWAILAPTSSAAGYRTIARAYADHLLDELAHKPLDRAFLDAFAERCAAAGRIVDIGCGPGHVSRYLAARGATVEGLDLSPEMIEVAAASQPGLAFRVGDMFALPYPDASLAGVVAFYAIVHLRADELGPPCRELARVVAPGGLVALGFHIGAETRHVDELFGQPTSLDFVLHRPEDVIAALATAGFTLEARLDRAPYPGAEVETRRCYLLARR